MGPGSSLAQPVGQGDLLTSSRCWQPAPTLACSRTPCRAAPHPPLPLLSARPRLAAHDSSVAHNSSLARGSQLTNVGPQQQRGVGGQHAALHSARHHGAHACVGAARARGQRQGLGWHAHAAQGSAWGGGGAPGSWAWAAPCDWAGRGGQRQGPAGAPPTWHAKHLVDDELGRLLRLLKPAGGGGRINEWAGRFKQLEPTKPTGK